MEVIKDTNIINKISDLLYTLQLKGEFLIPYFIQLIFCGLPLFYMELAIGQFHHTGLFTLWEKICPLFKGNRYGLNNRIFQTV